MTSHPEFGFSTTATEAGIAFSDEITGKNSMLLKLCYLLYFSSLSLLITQVVITGVSPNSLGAALAHSLAPHSPRHLILASRNLSNLSAVSSSLLSLYPELRLSLVPIELASQKSVRKAAAQIKDILRDEGGLDVLFNNAGVNVKERRETEEGVELQFGVNHVGGFLLTNCLMGFLIKGGGRAVMTSSEGHRISPVRLSDWNLQAGRNIPVDEEPRRGLPEGILRGKGGYEPFVAYGQSKTANILFAVAINETLKGRVRGLAVHPGGEIVLTRLA